MERVCVVIYISQIQKYVSLLEKRLECKRSSFLSQDVFIDLD